MSTLIPFRSGLGVMGDFRKEMDQLMQRFWGDGEGETTMAAWAPHVDVSESDDRFEVTADLPGMDPGDVKVEVRDGNLFISGDRKEEKEEKGKKWHRVERSTGHFERVMRLGDIDTEHVTAEYKDGVLAVTVPKTEPVRGKHVEVKH